MDLNSLINGILAYVGQVHPLAAAALTALVFYLRAQGWLKLPSLGGAKPAPTPTVPNGPAPAPDPLADHPLAKRLIDKVLAIFGARVGDGGEDHDDVYIDLINKLKGLAGPAPGAAGAPGGTSGSPGSPQRS